MLPGLPPSISLLFSFLKTMLMKNKNVVFNIKNTVNTSASVEFLQIGTFYFLNFLFLLNDTEMQQMYALSFFVSSSA